MIIHSHLMVICVSGQRGQFTDPLSKDIGSYLMSNQQLQMQLQKNLYKQTWKEVLYGIVCIHNMSIYDAVLREGIIRMSLRAAKVKRSKIRLITSHLSVQNTDKFFCGINRRGNHAYMKVA